MTYVTSRLGQLQACALPLHAEVTLEMTCEGTLENRRDVPQKDKSRTTLDWAIAWLNIYPMDIKY